MKKKGNIKLKHLLNRFPRSKVLVIGDLMLDHYIWGSVQRISPEAPVPVVNITSESIRLGGAANVFHNVVHLNGKGLLCGVVGEDDAGRRVLAEMKQLGVETNGVCVEKGRPTTSKTRIIAHNQQVVRFDQESKEPISAQSRKKILEFINKYGKKVGAIVLSDYAKGVIDKGIVQEVVDLSKRNQIPVVVDPKVQHFSLYKGVTIITPNHLEASQASGIDIQDEKSLHEAGKILLDRLSCHAILITRGEQGMSLFEMTGRVTHIPTVAKQVYDVTGAGDTVVSTLALCIASGANLSDASRVANHAAGIVVGEVGTAVVKKDMLREVLE